MFIRPGELKFNDQKFSTLIYGAPGVGKTTLAVSAPKALLIDLDEGIQRVKAQHQPMAIRVDTYEQLKADLTSEDAKAFDTYIIDTGGAFITLLQDYVMRMDPVNKTKSGGISQKGYGAVKQEFVHFTNTLKTVYKKNIVYVFHSVEEKNKDGNPIQRLLCEGSSKNIVWQPCDFGMYLFKNGDKTFAGFTPTDEYFAKGCYGITGTREVPFGNNVKNDFLARLFEEAKSNIAADSEFFKAEKDRYDAVMEEGRKLIEAVITPDQATEFTAKIKHLPHELTSMEELRSLFKERLEKIGIVWNRETKKYEYVKRADKHAEAEKTPMAAHNATDENVSAPTENDAQNESVPAQPEEVAETKIEQVSIDDFIAAADKKEKKGGKKCTGKSRDI